MPAPASPSASTAGRSAGPQPLGARVCSLVVDLPALPGVHRAVPPAPPPGRHHRRSTDRLGPPRAARADPELATRRAEILRLLLALVAAEAMYTPPPREAAARRSAAASLTARRRRRLERRPRGEGADARGRLRAPPRIHRRRAGGRGDRGDARGGTARVRDALLTDAAGLRPAGGGGRRRRRAGPADGGRGRGGGGSPAAERGLFSIVDDLFGGLWGGLDGALGLPRPKDKDAAGGTAAAAAGRGGPGGSRRPARPFPARAPLSGLAASATRELRGLLLVVRRPRGPARSGVARARRRRASPSSGVRFLPAAAFAGARRGYYFRLGDRGLGYYRDPNADAAGADSESVAVASPARARAFGPEPRPEEGRTLAASDVGPDAFDDDDDDACVRSAGANCVRGFAGRRGPRAAARRAALGDPLRAALGRRRSAGLVGERARRCCCGGDDAGVLDASRLSCFEEAARWRRRSAHGAISRARATSAEARGGLPLAFALLALVTRHAGDPNKGGFAQCAVFSIVQLSSDANFASGLAASCSPRWIPELELARDFRGSHADALVLCSRRLLLEAPPAWVAPLANPLLTTLHNVAPWFRRLNRDAASALLEMAAFHARPETLFAQPGERRNDRVKELALTVSPIDRCLRHAAEENPELIAAVCDERGRVLDRLDAFGPRATRNDDEIGDFRKRTCAADDGERKGARGDGSFDAERGMVARHPRRASRRARRRSGARPDDEGTTKGPGAGRGRCRPGRRVGFSARRPGARCGAAVRGGLGGDPEVAARVRAGARVAQAAERHRGGGVRALVRRGEDQALPRRRDRTGRVRRGGREGRREGGADCSPTGHENNEQSKKNGRRSPRITRIRSKKSRRRVILHELMMAPRVQPGFLTRSSSPRAESRHRFRKRRRRAGTSRRGAERVNGPRRGGRAVRGRADADARARAGRASAAARSGVPGRIPGCVGKKPRRLGRGRGVAFLSEEGGMGSCSSKPGEVGAMPQQGSGSAAPLNAEAIARGARLRERAHPRPTSPRPARLPGYDRRVVSHDA